MRTSGFKFHLIILSEPGKSLDGRGGGVARANINHCWFNYRPVCVCFVNMSMLPMKAHLRLVTVEHCDEKVAREEAGLIKRLK